MQSDSVNSVDLINDQFDEYQLVLSVKEKKLKLLVDLGNDDECNELISLLGNIKDKNIVLQQDIVSLVILRVFLDS